MAARKKAGGSAITKAERIAALVNGINKRNPGSLFLGEELTMPWALRRIPTSIIDLDIALNGGLPAGGLSMITGQPGVGKNWLVNQVLREQQTIYGDDCAIAVIGLEYSYDKGFGNSSGVRVAMSDREMDADDVKRKQQKLPPLTKEERKARKETIGTFYIAPPRSAESSFENIADLVKSREFNVIAIDSFGAVIPEEEMDKDLEDNARVAGAAGLNTRFMNKLTAALSPDSKGAPNLTCLLGLNQVRSNLKAQSFQKATHESGGWSLKHGRFVTIELTRTGNIMKAVSGTKRKKKVGKTIKWEITKQKAGGFEGHTGDYDYILETCDLDRAGLAITLASKIGLVQKSGSWYSYQGVQIGQGQDKAAKFLLDNELVSDIELEILQHHDCYYLT